MSESLSTAPCSFCLQPRGQRFYWCTFMAIEADEYQDSVDLKLCPACYRQLEQAIGPILRRNLAAEMARLQTAAPTAGL
jgi:hypothetical protein